jgi:hypothetical protein
MHNPVIQRNIENWKSDMYKLHCFTDSYPKKLAAVQNDFRKDRRTPHATYKQSATSAQDRKH